MVKLHYQGHGSYRLSAGDAVIYVDPFAGDGYDVPADVILVTHGHHDHDRVELPARKPGCAVITHREALAGGKHNSFDAGGAHILAVEACNSHHSARECVGYVIDIGGVRVYASGDTSQTDDMGGILGQMHIDCALYPIDGIYNMDAAEASCCAALVGARVNIPIHMKPGALFDRKCAERFQADGRIILAPGEELVLG